MSAGVYEHTHPDLPGEQALLDRAYACLGRMRHRAEDLKRLGYMGGNVTEGGVTPHDIQQWERDRQERIDQLGEPETALCFGRIDGTPAGSAEAAECWYIGRRHVEAENGEALIADWRAPVAVPFYRATVADTMGLARRRRFLLEGRRLLDLFEPARIAAEAGGDLRVLYVALTRAVQQLSIVHRDPLPPSLTQAPGKSEASDALPS